MICCLMYAIDTWIWMNGFVQITLDRSRASGMRTFLETTSADLGEAQGNTSTPIFGRDELDTVIVERLGLPLTTYSTPFAYLLACYKRVGEIKQSLIQVSYECVW